MSENDNKDEDNRELQPKNKLLGKRILKECVEIIKTVIIAIIVAYLITNFIIVNAIVPSASMEGTIHTNDRIVAFRLSYMFSEPERGDIIVFKYPDNEKELYVKRLIGLPGETVNIIDGKVYIDDNETPLEEDYILEIGEGDFGPYEVPAESYFMMGDNRNNSKDSRYWNNTFVTKDQIIGKTIFKYYPKIESLLDK